MSNYPSLASGSALTGARTLGQIDPAPSPCSEVARRVMELQELADAFARFADRLHDRVHPALVPVPPQAVANSTATPTPPVSPLSEQLSIIGGRLNDTLMWLHHTVDRVEL